MVKIARPDNGETIAVPVEYTWTPAEATAVIDNTMVTIMGAGRQDLTPSPTTMGKFLKSLKGGA